MKYIKYLLSILTAVVITMSFAKADETQIFNITNYPTVAEIKELYENMDLSNLKSTDGFSRALVFWNSIDAQTKTNYLEEIIRISKECDGMVYMCNPEITSPNFLTREIKLDADNRMAENGAKISPTWQWHCEWNHIVDFPKCFENYYNSRSEETIISFAGRDELFHRYHSAENWPMPAWINHYMWCASKNMLNVKTHWFEERILNRLPSAIKRRLREQGKTFFVNDETGENPVQNAIDEFIEACNSPQWQNVKIFVSKWWPDYEWVEISDWPSEEEINLLKDKVYFGEVDFNENVKTKLMNNLGIDAYNEFIEYYNK